MLNEALSSNNSSSSISYDKGKRGYLECKLDSNKLFHFFFFSFNHVINEKETGGILF